MRGAMLGYTKEFVTEEYEHIIEFSELRDFEDVAFKKAIQRDEKQVGIFFGQPCQSRYLSIG